MTAISSVEEIKSRYRDLASRIGINDISCYFNTISQHDGSAHIEQQGDEFHFVVTERGSELERRRTEDPDDILYWLFDGLTQGMATEYEFEHRDETRDGREIWFPIQEALLAKLNPEWGVRKHQHQMNILRTHPMRHERIQSDEGDAH